MAKKKNAVRKDGRIAVQVYLGLVDGKRKYKTVYGMTQKEADEKALQVKLALRKGIDVTADRDTFRDWAGRWLKSKRNEVSNGQYSSCSSCAKHLIFYLGDFPISKIRTADVQEVIDELGTLNPNTGRPSSKKTLSAVKITASQIFQFAIDNRVLDYNPVPAVKIPKDAPQDHRRALTPEEQSWIINTPHRAQRAAMIMLFAGLRRGELIPLTWSDINLDNRTISVNKSVEMLGGKPALKNTTKTAAGMRVIDIPLILTDYLRSQKRDSVLVCPSSKGVMMTDQAWCRMWESYLCDLNIKYGNFAEIRHKNDPRGLPFVIPKITAHWLRHTFATMLYMSGVDPLTAKEQLGHSDIKTTLQIYTHLDQQYKRRSMDKLDAFIGSNNDASQMQVSR